MGPTQKAEVIAESLRQKALLLIVVHADHAMAFGELLAIFSDQKRDVSKLGQLILQ